MTLVVLGAFFYSPPPKPSPAATQPAAAKRGNFFERKLQGLKSPSRSHPGENRAVFVAVVSRMILVPLILLPPVALIARYDYFEAAEDPVFIVSYSPCFGLPQLSLTLPSICAARRHSHYLVASRTHPRANHASRIRRCVRAAHLQDHLVVLRRLDSSAYACLRRTWLGVW